MTPGVLGGVIGSVVGILGGLIGTYYSIHNTNGPRERGFMVKCAIYGWIGVTVFLVLLFLLPHPYRWFLWVPYGVVLPIAIIKCNQIQSRIRTEETKRSRR